MDLVIEFVRENIAVISVLVVLCVAFVVLRNKPTKIKSTADFDSILSSGKPVVVALYNNM